MDKQTYAATIEPLSASPVSAAFSAAVLPADAAHQAAYVNDAQFNEVQLTDPPLTDAQRHDTLFNDSYLLAPVGYFVLGFDTAILQMNVVGADLLGLRRGQAARAQFRSFVAPRFFDDFDRFLRRALNSKQTERCDLQMARARQQQGFPVTLRASADSSGQAVRVVLELAEGKLAALERSEERFRRIVHSAGEGIWEIDAGARTSFVNPRMAGMLGYAIEDMLDRPLTSFMDDEGRALLERNIARRQHDAAGRHAFKFLRKDGSELWATLSTNPIFGADGAYLGALALVSDISPGRISAEQVWHQANFDALTELPNRHMFHNRLGQELKKARRQGVPLALLCIALDGRKQVAETLGREQGDALLVEAAARMNACVRASDTMARLDGDEFAVILSGLDDAATADRVAQDMLAGLQQPFLSGQASGVLSASIGIALYADHADHAADGDDAADAGALARQAGQAMLAARLAGPGRYSYFAPDLQLAAQTRQQLTQDMHAALLAQQFELHYQPIVSLRSGRIERAEALLRWRHPQRGLLNPIDFLAQAESGGMMAAIGDWVFRQAAQQAAAWRSEIAPGFQLSVNMSPAQLRGDPAVYRGWVAYAEELGLPPRAIVIELGEAALLAESVQVAATLRHLRDMGLQVALDNFGAGHASLSRLRHAGIDLLKLDQVFITRAALDTGELALCAALILMAHKLGLGVVAEGVESAAQHALLKAAGCDLAQGHVYAPAMPAAEFAGWARQGIAQLGLD